MASCTRAAAAAVFSPDLEPDLASDLSLSARLRLGALELFAASPLVFVAGCDTSTSGAGDPIAASPSSSLHRAPAIPSSCPPLATASCILRSSASNESSGKNDG